MTRGCTTSLEQTAESNKSNKCKTDSNMNMMTEMASRRLSTHNNQVENKPHQKLWRRCIDNRSVDVSNGNKPRRIRGSYIVGQRASVDEIDDIQIGCVWQKKAHISDCPKPKPPTLHTTPLITNFQNCCQKKRIFVNFPLIPKWGTSEFFKLHF
jgi:hypothetical protein